MADKTGNPIYKLMLNAFPDMFVSLFSAYFAIPLAPDASRNPYRALAAAIQAEGHLAAAMVRVAMEEWVAIWEAVAAHNG